MSDWCEYAFVAVSAAVPLPPTELVGRETELAIIRQAFADGACRLVTLTGPPGVGKTHLAIVAATDARGQFADGELFVDLASTSSPSSALGEVARAVGSGEAPAQPIAERLIDGIGGREILLVLDNCEHLLPMPELAIVVARCPNLHILATSRERLHLAAEQEIAVAPLSVPAITELDDADKITASSSVQLLVRRINAVRRDFVVTPDNSRHIGEVCIRLDGLPLALELAAAQLKMFTPGELAYRLTHRSILLAGGSYDMPLRHRGLRDAIGWSFQLMMETERVLFRRLAVFAGGWTLAAAEAICGFESTARTRSVEVEAAMASLVGKSIVRCAARPDGVTTFSMLGSVREFAAEQLAEHHEEVVRDRHARFYASLADEAERRIGTPDEDTWWAWLGFEYDNLRSALKHCLASREATAALQLAASLGWYWYTRGFVGEGRVVVDRALNEVGSASTSTGHLAAALLTAGILAWSNGDGATAVDLLSRSRQLNEETGDSRRRAVASAFLGHVAREAGEFETAEANYAAAATIFEALDHDRGRAWSCYDRALLAWSRGETGEAMRLFADSLDRFRGLAYPWAVACASWGLGSIEAHCGDMKSAKIHAAEALDENTKLDDRRGQAQCLELAAQIAQGDGLDETAGRLLGAATSIRNGLAAPGTGVEVRARASSERSVRQALGDGRADRAFRAGSALPISTVLALARRVLGATLSTAGPPAAWPSPREREVAAQVAAGCTNREIGKVLGISEKTVEVHIRNTMAKLDCRSRAEIAAWAVAHGVYELGDAVAAVDDPYT